MNRKHEKAFTLIELMIVVAIIGVLAMVAVSSFITYRNKSRISARVVDCESIRSAFASFAVDTVGNSFPAAIANWAALHSIATSNGASLKSSEEEAEMSLVNYTATADTTDANIIIDYQIEFRVTGVSALMDGSTIIVRPSGIFKQTTSP